MVFDGAVVKNATRVVDKGGARVHVAVYAKANVPEGAAREGLFQRGPATGSGTTASGLSERNVSVSSR
jgi:hypothetical protein